MKTNIHTLIIFCLFLFAAQVGFAQTKTTKANIKVFGNCGMCKERIESALDKGGVKLATWDAKTKNLEVVYNAKKITELEIHELIAAVGHDTEKVKAKDAVYAELPFCCLYRDHDHSGMKDDKHNDH
jgi:periplasmic mercuric ion binding protein